MMGEVVVKLFGSICHLINRTDFKNGKLDIVSTNDNFIVLNFTVYMFCYVYTYTP